MAPLFGRRAPRDVKGQRVVAAGALVASLGMLAVFGNGTMAAADLDDDGSVNVNDLLMLIERWGACEE